jgi:metallophosphoesterase (TIGR00282 family)
MMKRGLFVVILYIAELCGKAGVYALKKGLPALKEKFRPDFVIACADGATGGNGLGRNHAAYLRKLGADALTLGDCCFYKKDLVENISKMPYVLRPWNLNAACPGSGFHIFKIDKKGTVDAKIACAALAGQNGAGRLLPGSPFAPLPGLLEKLRAETPFALIDFHAAASGEKRVLFEAAKGKLTAVIGSGSRVQTADEAVEKGTALITDAGRTGSAESVGGAEIKSRIREYVTGIPDWTRDAWGGCEIQGVAIEADGAGRAVSIARFKEAVAGGENPP